MATQTEGLLQLKTKDGLHTLVEMRVWDIVNLMILQGKLTVNDIDAFDLFLDGKKIPRPAYADEE